MSLLLLFHSEEGISTTDPVSGAFVGDLQGVAVLSEALDLAAVQALAATAIWTDVTDDCEQELVVDRGIHEDSPTALIAPSGICTLTLDNSHLNTAGLVGYYSPPNPNARANFDRGTPLRVSMVSEAGDRIVQFVGRIRQIRPTAGEYRDRRVAVMATDWMDEAIRAETQGLSTKTNIRADELLGMVIENMRHRPHGIAIDTGTDVYPFALDTSMDRHRVHFEVKRTTDSERGLAYVDREGRFVFESRYNRTLRRTSEYVLEDVLDADVSRSTDDVVNRVLVRVYPRRPDATDEVVLYSNDKPLEVANGQTTTVFLGFRDPTQEAARIGGTDLQLPPTPGVDYVINTSEDGGGADLTADPDIGLIWTEDATGVYLTVSNNAGQRVFFTLLQIRGRGLYHYDALPIVAENPVSIDDIGTQQREFDMPYQDDADVGLATAQLILNMFNATPTKVREVPFYMFHSLEHRMLGAYGDISTRLTFREAVSGLDTDYFVNAKRISWKVGNNVDVMLWLAAADQQTYGIFDESIFDGVDRFAY